MFGARTPDNGRGRLPKCYSYSVAHQVAPIENGSMGSRDKRCIAFGKQVRTFRAALDISQEELAARTHIHRTYIGGIERGERNPTLLMIHRLADALNVDPAALLRPPGAGTGR